MENECACSQDGCSVQKETEEDIRLRERMGRIDKKILVLSGKGGVGKSTVAANLATSLAKAGKKVGLLDVDLHGPSIPGIMGLTGQRCGADSTGAIEPLRLTERLSVVSVGMMLDSESDAVIWRGPLKFSVIRRFLQDVDWGDLDYLVIDSPPGTGDEPLSVAQLTGPGAQALIVTTPQEVAIADVKRSISFCRMLKLPILGVLENMSGMICPHCGKKVDLFKTGGGEKLAAEMDAPFMGRIPIDPHIVASGDTGMPFVDAFEKCPAATAFAEIIEPILNPAAPCQASGCNNKEQENGAMKIAIPIAGGELCMHFGHCEQFAIVEVAEDGATIAGINYLTPPPHEPGVLPRWLHEQGANMIIAGGMGSRAQGLFSENGIQVVVGAAGTDPTEIVNAYLGGTLASGENVCDH